MSFRDISANALLRPSAASSSEQPFGDEGPDASQPLEEMGKPAGGAPARPAKQEVDLLGALTASLDTFLYDHPPPPGMDPKEWEEATERKKRRSRKKKKKKRKKRFTTSRRATRDFLATKTLVRSIAKACAREDVAAGSDEGGGDEEGGEGEGKGKGEGDEGGKSGGSGVVELIFDAFKGKYPSLTKEMLTEGMARRGNGNGNDDGQNDDDAAKGDDNDDSGDDDGGENKLERIVAAVDAEMEKYHARIEALRKSRAEAAANPPVPEEKKDDGPPPSRKRGRPRLEDCPPDEKPRAKRIRKRRPEGYPCKLCGKVFSSESGLKYHLDKKVCQEDRPRKVSPRQEPNTPRNLLIREIVKKYTVVRELNNRPQLDRFEDLVNETKRERQMEDFEIPDMSKFQKLISAKWRRSMKRARRAEAEGEAEPRPANQTKVMIDEIYVRYAQTKFAHGDKLPFGTLGGIIDEVKAEHGVSEMPVPHLKVKIQNRFRKEHPEFEETNDTTPGQCRVTQLTEEQRKRRQQLLNVVATRYVALKEEREASGAKKLEDGTLERVIEQAKEETGIHEFNVNKSSIWGRIKRGNLVVNTVGRGPPVPTYAHIIDGPLVSTVNEWLNQGISVAPEQGLTLANMLLRGKNLVKDQHGNDIMLDEIWWRKFLKRNKRNLNCLIE